MKSLILLFLILQLGCMSTHNVDVPSYDSRLTQFDYPFKVYNYAFTSQRIKLEMSYMDVVHDKSIDKNKLEVVVLLHGKNFSGFYWEQIAKQLAQNGFRVLIIDQIGFGKSSKPYNYSYSFPQLAINTKSLLDHLKIKKYHVVGHSMGGMLATTFAFMYPSQTTRLTLINPIGLENYLNYVDFKDPDFFYQIELSKSAKKIISYQKKNYYDGKWNLKYEQLVKPLVGQLNGPDWPLVAWNNALTYGPIFSENIMDRFGQLKLPVNIILGTRDRTGPGRKWKRKNVNYKLGQYDQLALNLKAQFSKFNVIELKGLGHMPQFEDYHIFSKIFYPLF